MTSVSKKQINESGGRVAKRAKSNDLLQEVASMNEFDLNEMLKTVDSVDEVSVHVMGFEVEFNSFMINNSPEGLTEQQKERLDTVSLEFDEEVVLEFSKVLKSFLDTHPQYSISKLKVQCNAMPTEAYLFDQMLSGKGIVNN